ncbi:cytidine deaminase [Entomohabitans teleogrylli]|uniref:cytidine deaminase n=1 Tax=Entomohabitans teleogrylli TaxID=1384589 RepID=UPI00073D8584|nr:cytidine deaminase [Entomohabitans teleogrylli]
MHPRFDCAFATLPEKLQAALLPLLNDDHFPAMLNADEVQRVMDESGLDRQALSFALLPLAAACAQTPVSRFNVGAIASGESGNLYFGANMEFPGTTMQQTIHAEQSAVTHAWMRGETRLTDITVNYTPCGHCRQFMNELNSGTDLLIHLPQRQPGTLGHYLPDAFGPRDLQIATLLMDPCDHGFIPHGDALTQAAIDAASRSHAPYSDSPSGVALALQDGAILTGRYAENAAYNPSLPPLQAALNLLFLTGRGAGDISRAVLAEREAPLLTQWDATLSTLESLGCTYVERVAVA